MKLCALALLIAFLFPGNLFAQAPIELLGSDSQEGDLFGRSVAVSGNEIVVGATGHDGVNGSESGAVYVFEDQGTGWAEVQKLFASDGSASDRLGHSVAISGNYIITGAIGTDDNGFSSGSAYVFRRGEGAWVEHQKLTAVNADARKFFGEAVAMYGDFAIIGAPGIGLNNDDPGTAHIYQLVDAMWTEIATLSPSDGVASDSFGISVAISDSIAVVGASQHNVSGVASGAAYVFARNGSQWNEVRKISAGDGESMDFFGATVAVSDDELLIGAYGDDDNGEDAGAVYFFQDEQPDWVETFKYIASDGTPNNSFGRDVAMNELYAVIGERKDDDVGQNSGAIYILRKENETWIERGKLINQNGINGDLFGFSVGIGDDIAVVGVPRADFNGSALGSVLVYELETITPAFTSLPVTEVTFGETYSYDVEATGIPTPLFSLTSAPVGMMIDEVTGLIQWTPTEPGDYPVTVSASNGIAPDATQEFTVVVLGDAPVITAIADTSIYMGLTFDYTIEASAIPEAVFALVSGPAGMTVDLASGAIQWTPSSLGDFSVTVSASNGIAPNATESFTISVLDTAPVLTAIPDTSIFVGEAFTYDVEATGLPVPVFSLNNHPLDMSINSNTGILQWTPMEAGEFTITVIASNGINPAATDEFTITVTGNTPALAAIPDTTIYLGQTFTYDVDATGNPASTYSIGIGPPGMAIDSTSGVIQWTPTAPNDYVILVVASNGLEPNANEEFTITVLDNAPTITSTPAPSITINETYTYQLVATGRPAPTFFLSAKPSGMGIDPQTGIIEWTPRVPEQVEVVAVAQNGIAPQDTQRFFIDVMDISGSSIDDETVKTFSVQQNYPNPFSASTKVEYTLADPGAVHISVFDMLGRKRYEVKHAQQNPGRYAFDWDGRDQGGRALPAGMYLLQLTQEDVNRKVITLIKSE